MPLRGVWAVSSEALDPKAVSSSRFIRNSPRKRLQQILLSSTELLPGLVVPHRLLLQSVWLQVSRVNVLGRNPNEKKDDEMLPQECTAPPEFSLN